MTDEAPKLHVYRAIAAITSELGKQGIAKARQANAGGKFMFRGIDQVYEALNPLLSQHNLVIFPRVISREQVERKSSSGGALFYTTLRMEFDFVSAEDGSKHTACTVGEAMDSGDKSSNKAMAIAFKYAAFLTFCIPVEGSEDDDPDATVHQVKSRQEPDQQPKGEPNLTQDQAERNYNDILDRADLAKTVADLKTVYEGIDWSSIPKPWKVQMDREIENRRKKLVAASAQNPKAPQRSASPPVFGEPSDDIPF